MTPPTPPASGTPTSPGPDLMAADVGPLEACPFFCCPRAEIASCQHGDDTAYFIRCLGCGAEGPRAKTRGGAVRWWNQRSALRSITAVVSERSGTEGRWWFFRDDAKAVRFMKAHRESLGMTAWIDKPRDGDDESTWPGAGTREAATP